MAQKTSQITQCPPLETWCAYVDGSLSPEEHGDLGTHLQQCDQCFSLVVSLKQSVEEAESEDTLPATPPALLQQASQAPTSHYRWWAYAAAVLVLGLGLQAAYQSLQGPLPLSAPAIGQLAMLNEEIQAHGTSWPEVSSEGLRGNSQTIPELSPADRSAVSLGATLVKIYALVYANQPEHMPYHLNYLRYVLNQMPSDNTVTRALNTFESQLSDQNPDPQMLHQSFTRFVNAQQPDLKVYFDLGQWLQSLNFTAETALHLSIPFADLAPPKAENLITRLQTAHLPENQIEILKNLQNETDAQVIIARVHSLLNLMAP